MPADQQPPSVANEQVLSRQLSSVQQTMMAIGGAFGTGLFLASGLAVHVAGPAIIVSDLLVAGISLLLGRALTEMAVAHPTAGAFGVYAGMYLSPFAGYAVRISYWLMQVIATGGTLVAASVYMGFWFPQVPSTLWVLAFAVVLLYTNSRAVGRLGAIESFLVLIKLTAVALFVVVAALVLFGATGDAETPAPGLTHLTAHGGFAPFGLTGIWLGCCFAIYSFIGVEIVGVTSGEAADPARTIPAAMRRMVLGLSTIYLVTLTLLNALTPWDQLGSGESPFVSVLAGLGIPAAAGIMNFVVLSAALSNCNANLYLISRTLFSLSRAGFLPTRLGEVNERGTPLNSLFVSSLGLGATVLISALSPRDTYVWFFSVALFGALFVWLMIFVTHIAYRRAAVTDSHAAAASAGSRSGLPLGSCLGAAAIAAILISTRWVSALETTLLAGGPWLLLLAIGYHLSPARRAT
jgi:L-asparagine transporter-like permease